MKQVISLDSFVTAFSLDSGRYLSLLALPLTLELEHASSRMEGLLKCQVLGSSTVRSRLKGILIFLKDPKPQGSAAEGARKQKDRREKSIAMLFSPRVPLRDDEGERKETIPSLLLHSRPPRKELYSSLRPPKNPEKAPNLAQITPLENRAQHIPPCPHTPGDLPVSAFSVPDGFPRLPWKHALQQQLKRPFPTCRRRKPSERAQQPSYRSHSSRRCRRPENRRPPRAAA